MSNSKRKKYITLINHWNNFISLYVKYISILTEDIHWCLQVHFIIRKRKTDSHKLFKVTIILALSLCCWNNKRLLTQEYEESELEHFDFSSRYEVPNKHSHSWGACLCSISFKLWKLENGKASMNWLYVNHFLFNSMNEEMDMILNWQWHSPKIHSQGYPLSY